MPVQVKICGITTEEAMEACVEGGASFVGLVFFPKSPRAVTAGRAAELLEFLPEDILKVGLFVDPDDRFLDETLSHVRLDLLQLHGKESPERLNAIRLEYGLPVMKAVSIATIEDLAAVEPYLDVVDWLLFDAKAPPGAKVPGGRGVTFDWSLLKGQRWPVPWMLAGGLNAGNLTEAVRTTGAGVIDVSSGVEDSPGIKNPQKILDLLEAADRL